MPENVRTECPKCSRQLEQFNGHIGLCSVHGWVSPEGLGYEAEAAEKNRQIAEDAETRKIEIEKARLAEIERLKREAHMRAVRNTILIITAILVIIAGAVYFFIRPSLNYSDASKRLEAGEYEAARKKYAALGTYKDSAARVTLCDALIDLQEGRPEEAAEKLDLLIGEGQDDLSARLGNALIPIMADWKNKGLTPELLLKLLQKVSVIDPKGTLDTVRLTLEGHAALLEDEYLRTTSKDVTGDGVPELITLNPDYSVTAYHMAADSNILIPTDESIQADCLMQFGNECRETDIIMAVDCYTEAYGLNPADEARSAMEGSIRTVLQEWKSRGISPENIPALVRTAREHALDLSGIDADRIYEEAAIAASGSPVQYSFTDWDNDGYKELLALYSDGKVTLSGIDGSWKTVSSAETKLSGASFVIAEEKTPLILFGSGAKDELTVLTGTGNRLRELFRESGINHLAMNAKPVTFSRELKGSITRNEDYSYDPEGTANRPERVGINWQKNAYPQPASAAAAVLRYFESRCYNIPEETALLIAAPVIDPGFDPEILSALPAPDDPDGLNIAAYREEEDIEYFEVTYPSGTKNIRIWIAAENSGSWKVTGAAETYADGQSIENIDFSIPLLSLNAETKDTLDSRGNRSTWRVLVPGAGRVGLSWQSGDKISGSVSHNVTMTRGSLTGEKVFGYDLKPSPNIQKTVDMFAAAGVYYVTVEAKAANTAPFTITISYKHDPFVEKESNDTYQRANHVELNTTYSANLSSAGDVDWYSFTLNENSAVNVSVGTSGNVRGTSTAYTFAVNSGSSGIILNSFSVPGNAKLAESGTLYLSAGSYFIQAAKGSSTVTDEYNLTVNTVPVEGLFEFESNDTAETANAIPLNEDVIGTVGKEGDTDFFRFTLDSDAVIQPKFGFAPTDSSSRTYVLTVSSSNYQDLLKVNIGGKESSKVIAPLALPAGSYFVKIENPRFIRQDYTLNIYSEATDEAEKEPNDSPGLANSLTEGKEITGVLSSGEDNDYYRLKFDDTKEVTLKFAFTKTAVSGTAYALTIEQNGKVQWTANIKGDSGGIEQKMKFSAGEYFIRIKPSAWISAVYTIEVK